MTAIKVATADLGAERASLRLQFAESQLRIFRIFLVTDVRLPSVAPGLLADITDAADPLAL